MKRIVDRTVACERAVCAEVAAAWPTGARFPYLPVFEPDEGADDTAKEAATIDPGANRRSDSTEMDPD